MPGRFNVGEWLRVRNVGRLSSGIQRLVAPCQARYTGTFDYILQTTLVEAIQAVSSLVHRYTNLIPCEFEIKRKDTGK